MTDEIEKDKTTDYYLAHIAKHRMVIAGLGAFISELVKKAGPVTITDTWNEDATLYVKRDIDKMTTTISSTKEPDIKEGDSNGKGTGL